MDLLGGCVAFGCVFLGFVVVGKAGRCWVRWLWLGTQCYVADAGHAAVVAVGGSAV